MLGGLLAATLAAYPAAWAAEQPIRESGTLDVCMGAGLESLTTARAKLVASQVFGQVGVSLQWHDNRNCPLNAVQVVFSTRTPADLLPGAMAYALPYEGTRIMVFADRLRLTVEPRMVGSLMGYVLAHEIGHVLEGVNRHSVTGVMKAHFAREDYGQMSVQSMFFAPEDATFIQAGLAKRQLRILASR